MVYWLDMDDRFRLAYCEFPGSNPDLSLTDRSPNRSDGPQPHVINLQFPQKTTLSVGLSSRHAVSLTIYSQLSTLTLIIETYSEKNNSNSDSTSTSSRMNLTRPTESRFEREPASTICRYPERLVRIHLIREGTHPSRAGRTDWMDQD